MMHQKFFVITEEEIAGFEEYLTERENAPSTIEKYMRDVRCFRKFLDGETEVTKAKLMEYKGWLEERYELTSANSMLASLNQFLIYIGKGEMRTRRFKVQKPLMQNESRNLTEEELRRLCDAARSQNKNGLAMLMETIVSTGIRISELQFITVEAVHRGRASIRNKGKHRVVLLSKALKGKLEDYIGRHNIQEGPVFVTRNGKPLDRSNIWRQMKKLCEKAGVLAEKVFPHNLRHLFARMYYKATKDLTGLADILGHSSIEVTRIYTAETEEHYQEQLDRIEFIKGGYGNSAQMA